MVLPTDLNDWIGMHKLVVSLEFPDGDTWKLGARFNEINAADFLKTFPEAMKMISESFLHVLMHPESAHSIDPIGDGDASEVAQAI